MQRQEPVAMYARMWPRELFSYKIGRHPLVQDLDVLSQPGVYVLYCDDKPFYVGKAKRLRTRLRRHANKLGGRYYDHWNYFSVFVVQEPTLRTCIESLLIAAIPTANGARPRIAKAQLPIEVRKLLHEDRHRPVQVKAKSASASD